MTTRTRRMAATLATTVAVVLLLLGIIRLNGQAHATAARRPQFILAGDTLLLAWMMPVTTRRAEKGEPDSTELRYVLEVRYGVLAQQGEIEELPLPYQTLKIDRFCDRTRFPMYRLATDGDTGVLVYEGGSLTGMRDGGDLLVQPFTVVDGTFQRIGSPYWYPPRPHDDLTGLHCPKEDIRKEFQVPAVSLSGNTLTLAWRLKADPTIKIAVSPDRGATWGPRVAIGIGHAPALASLGETVLLTAMFSTKNPFGTGRITWPDDIPLFGDSQPETGSNPGQLLLWRLTKSLQPVPKPTVLVPENIVLDSAIATDGTAQIYIVYGCQRHLDDSTLWLLSSTDGGKTWTKPEQLTDDQTIARDPCATLFNGDLWIAYSRRDMKTLKSDIRVLRRPLGGRRSAEPTPGA